MNQAQIENKHCTTHRFLADRLFKAKTPERKIFYKKMMQMNDCRMIEEMLMARKHEKEVK